LSGFERFGFSKFATLKKIKEKSAGLMNNTGIFIFVIQERSENY